MKLYRSIAYDSSKNILVTTFAMQKRPFKVICFERKLDYAFNILQAYDIKIVFELHIRQKFFEILKQLRGKTFPTDSVFITLI